MDQNVDISNPDYVRDLFDRVSNTYGYTNYLASFGFTERWRKQCVDKLPQFSEAAIGIDLMCGRGETWRQLFRRRPRVTKLTALDISPVMIAGAKEHARKIGVENVEFIEIDVFENALPPSSFDFVISTFGVKTFNPEQLRHLASEINRILKPGGAFSLIEVSDPRGWWLRYLYMFYLRRVMPVIEKVFLGYSYGFSMIGVYVDRFGDCSALKRDLEAYGLNVDFTRYFFGCATGLSGSKPKSAAE
jgi:demethylmenaquinone methyltransferase/2-methoxy-6-polyprenyl-1,4-benzoquinol methylase